MQFSKHKNSFIELTFLVGLSLVFLFLYGRYGYEGSDTSFMRGYSASLLAGKKIGSTLLFPFPGAIYITTLIQYVFRGFSNYVLIERYFFYLCTLGISYISYLMFFKEKVRNISTKLLFLGILFIFNTTNFPVALSYTVLATFFGILSLFFYQKKRYILAGVLAYYSYSCKTNFILLIVFLMAVECLNFLNTKRLKSLLFFTLGISISIVFFSLMKKTSFHSDENLKLFTSGTYTKLRKLYFSGFHCFALKRYAFIIIIPLFLSLKKVNDFQRRIIYFAITNLVFLETYLSNFNSKYSPYGIGLGIFFFNLLIFSILFENIDKIKNLKIFSNKEIQFLILAWVSSLSDTQPGPWLFTGTLFALIIIRYMNFKKINYLLSIFLIIGLMLNHLGSEYIYRNEDKKSAIFDMSILDNKYLGVKTNKVTIEKLKELKTISSNLNNIQVLPSLSDANFLLKKITCLPIVWDVSTGLNNRKKLEKKINLFSSMLNKCEYVILQKNVPTKYTIFTRMVIESWSISKDYNYWTVYKNNKQQKKHY